MFTCSRKELLQGITNLRQTLCAYQDDLRCDCKYGVPRRPWGDLAGMSEQTGCPELRCVEALLQGLTDEEYEGFFVRRMHTTGCVCLTPEMLAEGIKKAAETLGEISEPMRQLQEAVVNPEDICEK